MVTLRLGGKATSFSQVNSSHTTLRRGRSAHSHPIGLWALPPMGDFWDQPCQVLDTLPHWAQFHRGMGERLRGWGHSEGDSLRGYCLVLGLGWHHPQWETFDLSL